MNDKSQWLWPGWVPRAHLSLLCGPLGAQTAQVATWLATTVLGDGPMPDGARIGPDSARQVMWIDKEGNDRAGTLFRALGAPLDRVFSPFDPKRPKAVVDLADDRWLAIVADLAYAERPCWVIVDSLGGGDSGVLVRALNVMADIGRNVGCAVTFLCNQDEATDPSAGAAFADRMATVMVLDRWGPTTADMRFRVIESKLGAIPDSLRLRLETGIPEVVHEPPAPPESAVDRAVAFLERELAAGPQPALQLIQAANTESGISNRSLDRAKRRLRVRCYQASGRWWWAWA